MRLEVFRERLKEIFLNKGDCAIDLVVETDCPSCGRDIQIEHELGDIAVAKDPQINTQLRPYRVKLLNKGFT